MTIDEYLTAARTAYAQVLGVPTEPIPRDGTTLTIWQERIRPSEASAEKAAEMGGRLAVTGRDLDPRHFSDLSVKERKARFPAEVFWYLDAHGW